MAKRVICRGCQAGTTAPALFASVPALSQLWVFWLAPILGGIIGGILGRWLNDDAR